MSTSKPAENYIPGAPAATGISAIRNDYVADEIAASVSASLPSFFIIGPPRTGTSWLHGVLGKRTLLPSPVKETRFFDVHFHRGLDWYRAHYRRTAGDNMVGEVAPTYFASNAARERLARTIPEAKVVCIFRDPVERIFSHYRIKRAYGMIPWDFEEAILRDPELAESSQYASHFKEWQRSLGPGQVVATIYDDLRDEPQVYVDSLADVVGMPRFALTAPETMQVFSSRNMTLPRSYPLTRSATLTAEWCKARRLHSIVWLVKSSPLKRLFLGGGPPFRELRPELALRLYEKFRPVVEELEALLNRDLSAWKSPGFARRLKMGEIA
jgi:Sulfotransferase domain